MKSLTFEYLYLPICGSRSLGAKEIYKRTNSSDWPSLALEFGPIIHISLDLSAFIVVVVDDDDYLQIEILFLDHHYL